MSATSASEPVAPIGTPAELVLRVVALSVVALGLSFCLSSYLIFWWDWPEVLTLFASLGWFGLEPPSKPLAGTAFALAWLQLLVYLGPIAGIIVQVRLNPRRTMLADSESLSTFAAYIVRSAFWAVLLVGMADMLISFLRVEGLLSGVVGSGLAESLGRSSFRGVYVHYPLICLSLVIAFFSRTLGFTWLALLIVVAEIQIVIARFIFSYEQAFMADLVRFWYAALFLFASAYTLIHEGHVRVDILYTGFSERGKAWANVFGSVLLGISLCWVILIMGMWNANNVIAGPMLNYEVTQAGYGMYVKYFMAGFLLVYAISMLVQFASYFLSNAAILLGEPGAHTAPEQPAEI